MAASEEEQLRSMLQSMGVDSFDDSAPSTPVQPAVSPASAPQQALAQSALDQLLAGAGASSAGSAKTSEQPGVAAAAARDINIATLVHLLGISTSVEVGVIEEKVDMMSSKLTALAAKVDRLALQLEGARHDSFLERIDVQLSDIRAFLKKGVSGGAPGNERREESKDSGSGVRPAPTIMTSLPPEMKPGKKDKNENGEPDSSNDPLSRPPVFSSDEDFQAAEAERVRGRLNPKK